MTAPLPIILDCDPGIDDAMAILLALGAPEKVEIRAITCVNGNVGSEQTAINARVRATAFMATMVLGDWTYLPRP